MNRTFVSGAAAALIAAIWLLPTPSRAIPAFARKFSFSCTTCHRPFPKLKPYGLDFADSAFAPSDQEMPPRYYNDVGDDRLSLIRELPLALRADLYFDIRTDETKGDGFSDFKTPFGLKLLSGGRMGKDLGYYFYFFMNERGEVAGIEDAYLHFNDLFGAPLDLIIGQFQVSDPLFKRELRLTFQDYLLYKVKPGESKANLTYDRGLLLTTGFAFGLDVAAMVLNGNGKGEADARLDYDMDRYKNYFLRISQGLGPVSLGVFGYYGKEEQELNDVKGTNELNMWGPDLSATLGPVELNAQYLQRRDLNPEFKATNEESAVLTHGLMVEAIANLSGDRERLFLVALFNYVDSDLPALEHTAYTANLSYLLHTHVKAMAEYTFAPLVAGEKWNEHRFTLGVVAGM